jgi:hypothetical protein
VNFLPAEAEIDPIFLQVAPAFTAPFAGLVRAAPMNEIETNKARHLFISSDYLALLDLSAIPLEWEVIQAQEVLAGLEQGEI